MHPANLRRQAVRVRHRLELHGRRQLRNHAPMNARAVFLFGFATRRWLAADQKEHAAAL
jgi:hypothetical protein